MLRQEAIRTILEAIVISVGIFVMLLHENTYSFLPVPLGIAVIMGAGVSFFIQGITWAIEAFLEESPHERD